MKEYVDKSLLHCNSIVIKYNLFFEKIKLRKDNYIYYIRVSENKDIDNIIEYENDEEDDLKEPKTGKK